MRSVSHPKVEKIVSYRMRKIRQEAPIFLNFYEGRPDQKDRLYGYFSIYPNPEVEEFFILCPLCGWISKIVRPSYSRHPRLDFFSKVARILGVHLARKHAWGQKYEKHRIVFYSGFGEIIPIETTYRCLRCGAILPNLLVSVLHELVYHSSEEVR